jgi:hypothetical protein
LQKNNVADRQSQPPRSTGLYRLGRIVQILGLIIGLEALLVFGAEPSEGPMIYVTLAAVAVFYIGHWLVKRSGATKAE